MLGKKMSFVAFALVSLAVGGVCPRAVAHDDSINETNWPPKPTKMTLGPADDFVRDTYLMDLRKRIRRAWFPVKGKQDLVIVARIKINRDGSIKELKLTKPSGDAEADKSAEKAIKNAASFRQVGKGGPDILVVDYTFDIKKFGDLGQAVVQ